ncbi:SDR family NAD(P)-dependent oxidoreductase [Pseudoduganella aquatica]|uniref:SDR family NAD(P)-dependent oxidoreductase n=1 Tax=Pseudoduganella aquatica TaxID=2660641 RepID=A0A7X4H8G9_9BURK|nr:SDR family NAD(P)-dependent oxidoreductase [Pseudoduganella aquatica]MYN06188.1 SDR family NAD(P)-dependent oxidoreductase [Pseudoduganella aquatica]
MALNKPISDWQGRCVWIIGASSGIGEATARLLLERGAQVVLSARRADSLGALCAGQPRAMPVPLDITDAASVHRARSAIQAHGWRIDLVLVVAGGYHPMRADSFNLEQANRLLDLNLRGVYNCLDAVLPELLKQGAGGIGVVASVAGYGGLPKALAYGPTKAALLNLTETLYLDLAPRGIGVYQINPGFVATSLTAGNDFAMPALMTPEAAAQALVRGLERGDFHIHFPRRFSNSLRLLRLLPYGAYFWLVRKVTGL